MVSEKPNYFDWNAALIEFFTAGVPYGSAVYLEVTDRSLQRIGQQFWPHFESSNWSDYFLTAVKRQVVSVDPSALEKLRARDSRGRPYGVAFLGTLVLVATRMDSDETLNISEKDYFTRLNAAFGTEPIRRQISRPRFMKIGSQAEEPMWLEWARYLRETGYVPTAEPGAGGLRYIGYAISQTLVRPPEKRRLFQYFDAKRWPEDIDPELLVGYLRREEGIPVHLKRLLRRTGQAADAVLHAISEVFAEWCESGTGTRTGAEPSSRHLRAGLYRTVDWRNGEPEYALFPMQARNQKIENLEVEVGDHCVSLVEDRKGYYSPIGSIGPSELARGAQYRVHGSAVVQRLVFPKRDFWVLKADPDYPGSYATLTRPSVGEHFLLLVSDGLKEDVEKLKALGLLQYEEPTRPFDGWIEYPGAMVIANLWEDAAGIDPDLRDALTPTGGVAVSVSGGLRAPGTGGWLADAPPLVRVNSFFIDTVLTVRFEDDEIWSRQVEPGTPIDIPWRGPGVYDLVAVARGEQHSRPVRLVAWDELPACTPAAVGQVRLDLGVVGSLEGPRLLRPGSGGA